jgi:hypothetical protein
MKSQHLPLNGMVVSSICISLGGMPTIGFGGPPRVIIELDKAKVHLVRGIVRHQLSHLSEGVWEGDQRPFADILGNVVREAIGHTDGILRITFDDGWELTSEPVLKASRMYTWNWIDFAWQVVAGDTAWIGELGRTVVEEREKLR